jgi:hypothetical protein
VRAGKELADDMEEVVKEGDEGAPRPKDGVAVGTRVRRDGGSFE